MPGRDISELRAALEARADADRAPAMAAYMKHQFEFMGVTATDRRAAQRPFVAARASTSPDNILEAAEACWSEREREFQYVGADLLRRTAASLPSAALPRIEHLIRTRSWWDTVDHLAANVVGPMVAADATLLETMDRWIDDDDIWVARTATLFQLKWKASTDQDRLFAFVDRRCDEPEFFIRKAAGWALREYAKTDPHAVRDYVEDRGDRLSGLTRREALKHLR